MEREKLATQLSANQAFISFLVVSLVLSVVISIVLVSRLADSSISQSQEASSNVKAQLSAHYLEQFLNTRLLLMQDLARRPILVNGVMGSDVSQASLQDFLMDYHILGKIEPIDIVNVLGESVFTNTEGHFYDSRSEKILADFLDEKSQFAITLHSENNQQRFMLLVPIKYNGFTEGMLMIKFTTPVKKLLEDIIESDQAGIEITGQWLNYSNIEQRENYNTVIETPLWSIGLLLSYAPNKKLIDQSVSDIIVAIITAIIISLVLAWLLLLFIGQRLLLDPFRKLEQSEQAVKVNEARYMLAVDGSNDGIWEWDINAKSLYLAPRLREILGYESDDQSALPNSTQTFAQHCHPDDIAHVINAIKVHLKERTPFYAECRMRYANSEYGFFRVKGAALFDNEGKANKMAGSLTDISEQKKALQALQLAKEQNDLLAEAIESCNLGVTIADARVPGLPLTFINNAFKHITGYDESILGVNCRFLQGENTDKAAIEAIQEALSDQTKLKIEILNYRKDGEPFWNSLELNPVFDVQGKLYAYVGVQQDITALKKANQTLEEAKAQAEHASNAKSEFLASMSHEIRTPMNGVIGMLNLLANSKLDEEQHHRVEVAKNSAEGLLGLLNDILDFSKIDAGKLELEYLDFDLRTLLGEFAESAAIQAHNKDLEIILDMRLVEQSVVKGDPSRIRQILNNLVSNAIKFTSSGEVLIEAQLLQTHDDNWCFTCFVKDTGIGISKNQQEKLFKSFSQVDASTTRKYGGTGLGLAIVKNLCHIMQGDVSVTSTMGQGSCFKFNIELEKSDMSFAVMPTVDISQLDVLIVDDNATNRDVLSGQLAHWGAKVQCAYSGEQALNLCRRFYRENQRGFDIALLDMQMPNMDGAELGKRMKSEAGLHKTKLVMMTSMNQQGDAKYFADIGFSGYFPKPATTSDIFSALTIVAENGEALAKANPLVTKHYIKSLKAKSEDESSTIKWHPGIKLLLVEDNSVNQIVAKSMLAQLGLTHIDTVANGLEALQQLRTNQSKENGYSLILMDCQMPEMDGYEATKCIRNGEAGACYQSVHIIAMTANAMMGDREKCLDVGMNDYISKPISQDSLKKTLLKWLPHG